MTYDDVVTGHAPIGRWKFDETSGTNLQDATANNRDALANGLTLGNSSFPDGGTSVFCAGTDDYASVNASSAFATPSGSARSYSIWFRTTQTSLGRMYTVSGGGDHLRVTTNGTAGKVTTTRLGASITSSATVTDDVWHQVFVTDNATTVTLYVDGVSQGTGTRTSSNTNSAQLIFGADAALGTDYVGYLDEPAIYDYALTAAEVLEQYEAGFTDFPDSQFIAIGRADETDTALGFTPLNDQFVAIGLATETDTARDITPLASGEAQFIAIGRADEIQTAFGIGIETLLQPGSRVRDGVGYVEPLEGVEPPPQSLLIGGDDLVAVAFTEPMVTDLGRPVYSVVTASRPRPRYRVMVGDQDVTYFRGIRTPFPSVQLIEPCAFGPGSLQIPAIMPAFESAEDTGFIQPLAPVIVQQLTDAGTAVARDVWRGVLMSDDSDGRSFMATLGGEVSGPASLRRQPVHLTRFLVDVGRRVYFNVSQQGVPFTPSLGPTTGINVPPMGPLWEWDYICQLIGQAIDVDGTRWGVYYDQASNSYTMVVKDTTTVHATLYVDNAQVEARLRRDYAAEPTRVFVTAILPNGMLVNNAKYPGIVQGEVPPYPFADGRSFGEGVDDSTPGVITYTDGVILAMIHRLWQVGAIDREELPGGFDSDVSSAIRQVQREAGLNVTGLMNPNTWAVLYDVGGPVGYNVVGSVIHPMAQRTETRRWNYSPTGVELSLNPNYDPSYPVVDLDLDMTGFNSVAQIREAARGKLVPDGKNWVGEVVINGLGLIEGEHDYGDPLTSADVMATTELEAGMNIMLRNWDGGTLVHVSGVSLEDGGRRATLQVDTQARDLMEVWTIIQRDQEARKNLTGIWRAQQRSSALPKDVLSPWNHQAGVLSTPVRCPANRWTVFPVVGGQAGTVERLRIRTRESAAEFICAVFGVEVTREWLEGVVPNPLDDESDWADETKFERLQQRLMLLSEGTPEEPCGYSPGSKAGTGPLTGRLVSDSGFSYRAYPEKPVLWIAVYPDRACHVPAGRILWAQIETGT